MLATATFARNSEEMTTVSRKLKVLSVLAEKLSFADLQSIAHNLEVDAIAGRSKAALVDALVSSRTAALSDILGYCPRALLKQLCTQLGLSHAGKTKDTLIARIVDEEDLHGWSVPELRAFLSQYPRVPDELSSSERVHVERKFSELMEHASPGGLQGARLLVGPAVTRLRNAKAPWRHRVADLGERLAMLVDVPPIGPALPSLEVKAAVAAVRYFATSDSVLPDWDARTAIDDAYVFDLCHAKLSRSALLAIADDLD